MKKLNYDFLNCAKKMPPLYHTLPEEKFDIKKSEVVKWLLQQPELMQKLFNMAANNKTIRCNAKTGKWQGVDYED
ncbi:MAG: hypothetical protein AB9836_08345 [Aminipila sp.]